MKSQDRREQILRNAFPVFARDGLHGARTREIADACGINEALIYRHFDGKEDLFKKCLDSAQRKLIDEAFPELRDDQSGFDQLRAVCYARIDIALESPDICKNLLHGIGSTTMSEEMKVWVREWFSNQRNLLRTLIKRGIDDGSIKPDVDVEQTVMIVDGTGWSCVYSLMLDLHDGDIFAVARNTFDTVLDSLKAE